MAINFEPIFDGMQNGPQKIKENFDKINEGRQWGDLLLAFSVFKIASSFAPVILLCHIIFLSQQ